MRKPILPLRLLMPVLAAVTVTVLAAVLLALVLCPQCGGTELLRDLD